MILKEISFTEKNTGWEVKQAKFDKLTLLVGASGVGKTKILESIETLSQIAAGTSFNGIKWNAIFEDTILGEITWEGETEYIEDFFDRRQIPIAFSSSDNEEQEFKFVFEKMIINKKEVFTRKQGVTKYNKKRTVKLQHEKSLIYLLQEDDIIAIRKKVEKIHPNEHMVNHPFSVTRLEQYDVSKTQEDFIKDTSINIKGKLYLASVHYRDLFDQIKSDFLEIFPFIEDIRFANPDALAFAKYNPAPELMVLQLKEHPSEHWICGWSFSSGMSKIIDLLATIYLSPEGSIFLIDEFENNLGLNCIDLITEKILFSFSTSQLILTSHHPYIINNIQTSNWRLVTRDNGVVSVVTVEDKLSSSSKHDTFIQLINLDDYSDGIK